MARSMMLSEISLLLQQMPVSARLASYREQVINGNILGKPTFASRTKSFHHLQQLYGMDERQALFRILRELAATDQAAVPLMAMVCAYCRDAQLRWSFSLIDATSPGQIVSRQAMELHLETGFPGRFSSAMKKSLAQNVNTTWTSCGHLVGRAVKRRQLPVPRVAASVYAMLAGYLLGLRGDVLVQSVFSRLVGSDPATVISHLASAQARAWLRFRHGGGVTEIDFSQLLTPQEREILHGAH
jgi:hypothetical protein